MIVPDLWSRMKASSKLIGNGAALQLFSVSHLQAFYGRKNDLFFVEKYFDYVDNDIVNLKTMVIESFSESAFYVLMEISFLDTPADALGHHRWPDIL